MQQKRCRIHNDKTRSTSDDSFAKKAPALPGHSARLLLTADVLFRLGAGARTARRHCAPAEAVPKTARALGKRLGRPVNLTASALLRTRLIT
ncbi:hypothetical protein EVAR_85643_1 [Eumeta japonica]|uniref:Uncharacterized protein n=1 Tax=Eumeta variegata TaxID=151549 RepID=A0A4C1XRC1_EUMVA|nr:hypothetical protein EVAR_85643_1 [Eumeta japonica]